MISPQQALVICKACSKLVWLSITFKPSQNFASLQEPPMILHDLVSISISSGLCSLPRFMELISAPSLREMCVSCPWPISRDDESLLHFLSRSSCTLDRLVLGGYFPSGIIISLLAHRCCSLLTSLIISGPVNHDYPIIIRRLTMKYFENSLCTGVIHYA